MPATVHLCKHCFARGKADAEQAGWIPVGERSPEEGAVVLVSEGADLYRAYREDGQWMALSSAFPRAKVTHWMPLPPPPAAAKGGA